MGESLESGGREEKWSRAWHGIDGGWIPLNIHDLQRWADGPDNHQCTSGVPCSVCMEMAGQLHHYFINSFTHTVRHEAHTEYYPQRQQTSLALMWKGKKKWKKKKNKWRNEKNYNYMMFRFGFLVPGATNSQVVRQFKKKKKAEIGVIKIGLGNTSWWGIIHCNAMLGKLQHPIKEFWN